MASFSDINAYIESARQAHEHLESYKNDIVASKVGDVRERYEAAISKVSQFGQATLGASTAYHLGRKIYKKQKEKYGKDPAKQKKPKKETEGEEGEPAEGEEGIELQDVTSFKNPTYTPNTQEEGQNISKEPVKEEPAKTDGVEPETEEITGGGSGNPEIDSFQRQLDKQNADFAEQVKAESDARRAKSGLDKPDPNAPKGDTDEVADNVANNASGEVDDVANAASRTASSALDGVGDAAKAGLQGIKEAGENMLKNAGVKIAEKVGFDVAGAALDAVPVIGEIAGVAQIFHALFKEHKTRKEEEKKETDVGEQVRSMGTIAVGGIDTSARSGLATVAGLV